MQDGKNYKDIRLAVLIDADNISAIHVHSLISEIATYGTPTIKRIYGDWTQQRLNSWKECLLDHAISPVQQFGYTTGKNSTDASLIIDAMDILYSEKVDGFCLVSSDSDFTRLATRLRESGKIVYGIGEQKTPNAFVVSCDKFVYIDLITDFGNKKNNNRDKNINNSQDTVVKQQINKSVKKLIRSSIEATADEDGWASLSAVGNMIIKKQPSFDSRHYGHAKLSNLMKSIPNVKIMEKKKVINNNKTIEYFIKYVVDNDIKSKND